jgi:adenine-specific DNA-methyltransferase
LRECKPRLDEREKGRFKGEGWYCYGRPQNLDRFDVPEKIVLPDVANRGTCFLDQESRWPLDTAYAIVCKSETRLDLHFILALLNSPLLTYFLKETGTALRGGYFRMKTAYLNPFPIRTIDFSDSVDKASHDHIVKLVGQMLELQKKFHDPKISGNEKERLEQQIRNVDYEINQEVYKLYGITKEERKVIEQNV